MKIIFFSHSANLYGAELALLEIVETLSKNHECIVYLPENGPLIEKIKKVGARVEILKYKWWVYNKKDYIIKNIIKFLIFLFYFIYDIFLINKIKKHNPDLIISNTLTINIGIISSIFIKKPLICFIHEFVKEDHGLSYYFGDKFSLNIVNKYSSVVIVVSKVLYEKYKKYIDNQKIELLYSQNMKISETVYGNYINLFTEEYFNILIIGNISENKGQKFAIEALNNLVNKGIKKIKLFIAGSGDINYINKLKKIIYNYKLEDYIIFLGYVKNPYNIIEKSNCLLMLSKHEAFGRTMIEGMMCGKILIAFDSGSSSELINHGVNGLLCKKNSIDDLSLNIEKVYKKEFDLEKIEQEAIKFSSFFSNKEEYLKKINTLIEKAIKK